MARPLREQFTVATFVLLVPVGVVMALSTGQAYRQQLDQVYQEAVVIARAVALHIETAGPGADDTLPQFLERLPVPRGSRVLIADASGTTVHAHTFFGSGGEQQLTVAGAGVTGRPWTVSVGIPTGVAWQRAGPSYRRTIAISGLATLILLGMQMTFLRRWLPALASLERSAARVGTGDLDPPALAPMPARELEHVRDAFAAMVDRLREARAAIARQMEEERAMREAVQSLQQQVIRQERLAAIGVLVSGIAHELNNPLQTISGFSELLQQDTRLDGRVRADLALIHQESARASAIIRNLSRFGRQQDSTPTAVQLPDVVSSVVELRQRHLIERNIRLERDDRATRPARAVFTELQQVVLNFVINAEQALRETDPDARWIALRTADVDGHVHLEVEDSGPGVPDDDETKLFQPFFTTKPVGEGTGLGLSVSYGIVQSLGGQIGYRRGAAGGALFYFTVPAADPEAPEA